MSICFLEHEVCSVHVAVRKQSGLYCSVLGTRSEWFLVSVLAHECVSEESAPVGSCL